MKINISNVEDKVLFDSKLISLLGDDVDYLVKSWKFGRIYNIQPTIQDSIIKLLKCLKNYLSLLENYFGEKVEIDNLSKELVTNDKISIGQLNEYFRKKEYFSTNLVLHRSKNDINLTFWR